ncbi:hypothetical protein EH31_01415 [Erythrobacter longus]|uniref:Uncharacterized protein n=1 Tax=Erythrobacter longus TaxID=1044 RepID=A0A074M980_ERYLO|nr:hypothetical protein [Erythrobacter longus]KEO91351.1 hypothetical protein EH31_01415 [Erythrobacter longus]
MIQLTSYEIDDIEHCKQELEAVLQILDHAGAGIAAIHVNAAIEQLKRNLAALAPQSGNGRPAFFVEEDLD